MSHVDLLSHTSSDEGMFSFKPLQNVFGCRKILNYMKSAMEYYVAVKMNEGAY